MTDPEARCEKCGGDHTGHLSNVWGDLSGVRGDLSGVRGDLSDVRGRFAQREGPTGVWLPAFEADE